MLQTKNGYSCLVVFKKKINVKMFTDDWRRASHDTWQRTMTKSNWPKMCCFYKTAKALTHSWNSIFGVLTDGKALQDWMTTLTDKITENIYTNYTATLMINTYFWLILQRHQSSLAMKKKYVRCILMLIIFLINHSNIFPMITRIFQKQWN